MRSPDEGAVVARLPEPRPALLRRPKLRATLHTFTLVASLVLVLEQFTTAHVHSSSGSFLKFTEQNVQHPLASVNAAQDLKDVSTLEPGKQIERELAGGEGHSYYIVLAANEFLHAVIDQQGIDVVVTLTAPDGNPLAEFDSLNGAYGAEPVFFIAKADGNYRLQVQSLEKKAKTSKYKVWVEALRAAMPQDITRIAAESLFAEALRLDWRRNAESSRKAMEKVEEAARLYRVMNDHAREILALHMMGTLVYVIGERQKAMAYYNQLLPLSRTIGDRHREALALNMIGLIFNASGERQQALDHYEQALSLAREIGDQGLQAAALNNIGVVYSTLNEPRKSLSYYARALPLRRAVDDQATEAITLSSIGQAHSALGEWQKAFESYNQALALHRAVDDRREEAITLNSIGQLHSILGEWRKALVYFEQSLSLLRIVGDKGREADALNGIGQVHTALHERQKALAYHNQALAICRVVGDQGREANTLYIIARLERSLSNFLKAREGIESALAYVEHSRAEVASQELRASYFASVQSYYELYVDVLMRLHEQHSSKGYDARALEASERARARNLLESLTEARALIRQGADPRLLERERSLKVLLSGKAELHARLLRGKHTPEQRAALEDEISKLVTHYEELRTQIRRSSPRYAALTQPQPLSLTEIQRELDGDTLLLEYALGEERSYLWAVSATALTSYVLPKRAEIERQARRVYDLLTARNQRVNGETVKRKRARLRQAEAEYTAAAGDLSRALLAPAAAQLKGKRLIVVADGALQYVPFAALPDPAKPSGERWQPLIVAHEVASLPSASVLAVIRQEQGGHQPAAKRVAVLADPVFKETDLRVRAKTKGQLITRAKPHEGRDGAAAAMPVSLSRVALERSARDVRLMGAADFPRLEYTRELAGAVLTSTRANEVMQALDFKASRATATGRDLSQYRTVIFATHGLLNSKHPELSGLVLSLVDEVGRQQDGFLRLHDVYNMELNAELVVLGACETGLGKEVRGEGLVGLTRGFMYAGARRVMASLWKVDEDATVQLIKRMYERMERGGRTPAAAALREAQVSMSKEKRFGSPYYWAGFILQGEYR